MQSDGAEDAPVLQEAEEAPDVVQGEVLVPGQPRGVDRDAVVSENGGEISCPWKGESQRTPL